MKQEVEIITIEKQTDEFNNKRYLISAVTYDIPKLIMGKAEIKQEEKK